MKLMTNSTGRQAWPVYCFWDITPELCRIYAAEGLLSALEACGIDNARIEIEGNGELPVYDGSASGFAYLIKQAGVRVAPGMDGSASQQKQAYAPQKARPYCLPPERSLTLLQAILASPFEQYCMPKPSIECI